MMILNSISRLHKLRSRWFVVMRNKCIKKSSVSIPLLIRKKEVFVLAHEGKFDIKIN